MSSGAISVSYGRLPAMNTTLPYSPMPRANASAAPVRSGEKSSGKITRRNVSQRPAPKSAAASSSRGPSSRRTGWTLRGTKGIPTKIRAIVMPSHENADGMPAA